MDTFAIKLELLNACFICAFFDGVLFFFELTKAIRTQQCTINGRHESEHRRQHQVKLNHLNLSITLSISSFNCFASLFFAFF